MYICCVTMFRRPFAVTVPLCLYKDVLELGPTLRVVVGLSTKQRSYREHSNKPGLFRFERNPEAYEEYEIQKETALVRRITQL